MARHMTAQRIPVEIDIMGRIVAFCAVLVFVYALFDCSDTAECHGKVSRGLKILCFV